MKRFLPALLILLALATPARAVTFVPVCRSGGALIQCVGQLAPASGGAPDLSSVAAGLVLAGPCTGGAASATLRALCSADLTTALTTPPVIGGTTPAAATFTTVTANTSVTTPIVAGSGTSTLSFTSPVSDGASAVGFDFNTTNQMLTTGAIAFRVRTGTSNLFRFEKQLGVTAAIFNTDIYPAGSGQSLGKTGAVWTNVVAASIGPSGTQQHTLPAVTSDTVALLAASQAFTNHTYTAPIFSGLSSGTYSIGGTYSLVGTPTIGADIAFANDNITVIGAANKRLNKLYAFNINGGNQSDPLYLSSDTANGASAVAIDISTSNTFSTTGALLIKARNNGTQKFAVHYDGNIIAPGAGTSTSNFHAFPSGTGSFCATDNIATCVTGAAIPFTAVSGGATGTLGAATVYLTGPGVAGSASEVYLGMGSRTAVAQNLYCQLGTAPGGSDTVVNTVRAAGADSSLTCTITGAATTCNDTTHRPAISAGNKLSIKAVSSAGTAASATCTFEQAFN